MSDEKREQRVVVVFPEPEEEVDSETMDEWIQSGNVLSPNRPERFRMNTSADPRRTRGES